MAKKIQNIYSCSKCGAQSPKWIGRCLECGAWSTMKEEIVDTKQIKKEAGSKVAPAELVDLSKTKELNIERSKTGMEEVDRVLGGGIVPGSLILLGGEPGIGKSTIVAQIADKVAGGSNKGTVVYVSGEESASQVKFRLERLKCKLDNIRFISETNVEKIVATVKKEHPVLAIIDSIQTVYSSHIEAEAGNVSQIRASAVSFLELAKENDIAMLLIGHITKDGSLAGPKTLEHVVDTVIYLEAETNNNYRILRAVKNRFGSVNELGIFEMTGEGFVEVKNPSSIFVEAGHDKIAGSVISCIMEGTRPFLVNIQALVSKTIFGYPQRKSSGFDLNRLQLLTSVLSKRTKVSLMNQDVIMNIVGGLKINDPALDLAVCMAIVSSQLNRIVDDKTLILGEVGLGGEVRNVSRLNERLLEAEKLGFEKAIIPNTSAKVKSEGMEIRRIKNIGDLLSL